MKSNPFTIFKYLKKIIRNHWNAVGPSKFLRRAKWGWNPDIVMKSCRIRHVVRTSNFRKRKKKQYINKTCLSRKVFSLFPITFLEQRPTNYTVHRHRRDEGTYPVVVSIDWAPEIISKPLVGPLRLRPTTRTITALDKRYPKIVTVDTTKRTIFDSYACGLCSST